VSSRRVIHCGENVRNNLRTGSGLTTAIANRSHLANNKSLVPPVFLLT
jgi:hypothetical protein